MDKNAACFFVVNTFQVETSHAIMHNILSFEDSTSCTSAVNYVKEAEAINDNWCWEWNSVRLMKLTTSQEAVNTWVNLRPGTQLGSHHSMMNRCLMRQEHTDNFVSAMDPAIYAFSTLWEFYNKVAALH